MLLLPSLVAGCRVETESFTRAFHSVWSPVAPLPAGAEIEFHRIEKAFLARFSNAGSNDYVENMRVAFARLITEYARPVDAKILAAEAMATLDGLKKEITREEAMDAVITAMVDVLDPHSAYLDREAYRDMQISTRGVFGGLGIEITRGENAIRVVTPIEDTPAFRAGLKPGDDIIAIDGQSVRDMTLLDAVHLMRGEPGTDVQLDIERTDAKSFRVTVTRAVINIRPVRVRREGPYLYIRISTFIQSAESELRAAWKDMQGSGPIEGLVLDLRNNPGGLLSQAVAIADAFLDSGVIVESEGRDVLTNQIYRADSYVIARGLPIVILINEGTASAAEIVAAALKDAGRADLIGRRSFGKGTVQTITGLPLEGGLRLTTALYRSPAGALIQGRGVVPDVVIQAAGDAVDVRREENLPRSFVVPQSKTGNAPPVVAETACPPAAEEADRMVGCGIAFLSARTASRFVERLTAH